MRCSPKECDLHVWASSVEQRRGRDRARVALARKLAVIMLAMWKKGERYQPRMSVRQTDGASGDLVTVPVSQEAL